MTAWLVSIVGIVFLSVIVDVITPEGKTNAFIKCVFSIFVLDVMISPIVKIFNKDFQIEYSEIKLQETYLESLTGRNIEYLENELQQKIIKEGYECFVEIRGNVWGEVVNIEKITVMLTNNVLISEDEHINNCKVITQIIKKIVEVDEEVIVYERI